MLAQCEQSKAKSEGQYEALFAKYETMTTYYDDKLFEKDNDIQDLNNQVNDLSSDFSFGTINSGTLKKWILSSSTLIARICILPPVVQIQSQGEQMANLSKILTNTVGSGNKATTEQVANFRRVSTITGVSALCQHCVL